MTVLILCGALLPFSPAFSQEEPPRESPEEKEAPPEPSDEEKPAPAAKDPEFKKESSKTDFEKAKSQYEMGKFKEAEAVFKRLKGDAKTKEDKDLVEKWVLAAGGSQLLERLKAQSKQSKLQQSYDNAQACLVKYKGTAVEPGFQQLVEELRSQLFVPLENFDSKSLEYSEKFGKFFIEDPKQLLDGTQCLRWTNMPKREQAELKIKRVPQDWRDFEALEFWVNPKQAPPSILAIIMCGEPAAPTKGKRTPVKKKKADPTEEKSDFYYATVKMGAQQAWQRIRLGLADFAPNGQATGTLASVSYFSFRIDAGSQFDFLIDKIVLIRKDQPVNASAKGVGKKK
jgi:hypothetical protein